MSILFSLNNPNTRAIYHATKRLGEGGFATVWGGFTNDRLPIAIKIIKPSRNSRQDFNNWLSEVKILFNLKHPHVVEIYDYFYCNDGRLVIIMEKAERNLNSLLKSQGMLNPGLVCLVGIQICSALEYIHKLRIIHRDLTLRNILQFPNNCFIGDNLKRSPQCQTGWGDKSKAFVCRGLG